MSMEHPLGCFKGKLGHTEILHLFILLKLTGFLGNSSGFVFPNAI